MAQENSIMANSKKNKKRSAIFIVAQIHHESDEGQRSTCG